MPGLVGEVCRVFVGGVAVGDVRRRSEKSVGVDVGVLRLLLHLRLWVGLSGVMFAGVRDWAKFLAESKDSVESGVLLDGVVAFEEGLIGVAECRSVLDLKSVVMIDFLGDAQASEVAQWERRPNLWRGYASMSRDRGYLPGVCTLTTISGHGEQDFRRDTDRPRRPLLSTINTHACHPPGFDKSRRILKSKHKMSSDC